MPEQQYQLRIPLALTGLTPREVTETLQVLAVQRQPALPPREYGEGCTL